MTRSMPPSAEIVGACAETNRDEEGIKVHRYEAVSNPESAVKEVSVDVFARQPAEKGRLLSMASRTEGPADRVVARVDN